MRQSTKPAGSFERCRCVDIERLNRRKRCAQIGLVVRPGEVGIEFLSYTLAGIEDIDAARVKAGLVIVRIFSRPRGAAQSFHELHHVPVDDAAPLRLSRLSLSRK
jgi:hypothetical protein